MKIRTNFVSNSSSSSFIIYGDNVKNIIKGCTCNEVFHSYEDYYKEMCFTVKELNDEIITQIDNKEQDEYLKSVVYQIIYKEIQDYFYYIKQTDQKETVHRVYQTIEQDILNDYQPFDIDKHIKNYVKKYIKANPNEDWFINCDVEFDEYIQKYSNNILNKFKKTYNEVYCVSFGDNHGECSGMIGGIIEREYLGEKQIYAYMKGNFEIYCINEH